MEICLALAFCKTVWCDSEHCLAPLFGTKLLFDCDEPVCLASLPASYASELSATSCLSVHHASAHASADKHVPSASDIRNSAIFHWETSGGLHEHLKAVEFELSVGRSISAIVERLPAGVHLARKALPQLISHSLSEHEHVQTTLQATHHVLCPSRLPKAPPYAFCTGATNLLTLCACASTFSSLMKSLAAQLRGESLFLASMVHPWLQLCLNQHNVALVRKIYILIAPSVFIFLVDHVFGLPEVGWAAAAHRQEFQ